VTSENRPVETVGVLTVDDHPQFRRMARRVVEATPGFELLGEASSGEEAIPLADTLDPDLILLDVRMGGIDGVETARRLHATHPDAVIVLVSTERAAGESAVAGTCGAAAFLPKQELCAPALQRLWTAHRHAPPL
jgi:DNA-binding NarL/FixJ family response regulator